MDGFDDAGVFYSDNFGKSVNHDGGINLQATKKKYKEFLRSYHEDGFNFKYRYLLVSQSCPCLSQIVTIPGTRSSATTWSEIISWKSLWRTFPDSTNR